MEKEPCLVAGHKGAKERRGGRRRSEGESTQESRRRGERHADVEHAERVEEEALRGAVERGERRGVLAEMAAERQRTTPRHRGSDGATRTRGGGETEADTEKSRRSFCVVAVIADLV